MLDSTILDSSQKVVVECSYKTLKFNLSETSCNLTPPHSLSPRSSASSQSFEDYDVEINDLTPPVSSEESINAQEVVARTKYYVDKVN